jgi:dephospho-CoA kinase
MPRVIGLTGGIGSGKSTVATLFAELGATLVDTDAIAHELTGASGTAMPAIRAAFGDEVVADDGGLDRARMRAMAFSDPRARARLEQILHPMIREEVSRRVAAAGGPYVILVVPLLVEKSGYRDAVERIVVVDCPVELQIARVMRRSGLERPEIERIIAAQASREARLAAADDVVRNDGDLDHLRTQVRALHARYVEGGAD